MPKGVLIVIGTPKKSDRSQRADDGAGGMKESGFMPGGGDDSSEDSGASGDATANVPLEMIAADGTNPDEGDTVNFSVEGTVRSINGGTAVVSIDTINGEKVQDDSEQDEDDDQGVDDEGGEDSPEGPSVAPGNNSGQRESIADMGKRLRKKAQQLSM